MVFSLLAYFLSMVTAFVLVMGALIGFGDSQLRANRITHATAVSVLAGSDRDALSNSEKAREEQKAAEARKVLEAQRAAEAKAAEAKKIARAKLARERRQAMAARQRQERESALAFGYQGQFSNGAGAGLYSYAPRY